MLLDRLVPKVLLVLAGHREFEEFKDGLVRMVQRASVALQVVKDLPVLPDPVVCRVILGLGVPRVKLDSQDHQENEVREDNLAMTEVQV